MTYIETFVPGAFEIEFAQIFEKLEISVRRTTSDRRGEGECFAPLSVHLLCAAARKFA